MAAPNMDQFEAYFRRADLDGDGRISGAEAVNFFQGSNLPKHVLAQVLYKSRCDNRLNEITERASADKRSLNDDEEVATGEEDKFVLQFMDSLNNYLSLSHSLSSTLRQGWMELASARHSMGTSRVNTSLLDLKFHPAATTLKITESDGAHPSFMLRKWVSSEDGSTQLEDKNEQPQDSSDITSHGLADNEEVQKERSKSLSVFGVLISPKLRATQLSFETALETLIEIANMRSSLLRSFHQLHQEAEDTKE